MVCASPLHQSAPDHPVPDIATIRSQHRLCGVLTGTLPHLSQQNVFLGVPLILFPEEAVLLVEIGTLLQGYDPGRSFTADLVSS